MTEDRNTCPTCGAPVTVEYVRPMVSVDGKRQLLERSDREHGSPWYHYRPGLWADGIHDDTDALQWHIDNRVPVPPNGTYLVSRTLHVQVGGRLEMLGGKIVAPDVSPVVSVDAGVTAGIGTWGTEF